MKSHIDYLFEILLAWQACGSWGVLCLLQVELGGGHHFRNRLVEGVCLLTNQGIILIFFTLL